jgi:hypothetical protein
MLSILSMISTDTTHLLHSIFSKIFTAQSNDDTVSTSSKDNDTYFGNLLKNNDYLTVAEIMKVRIVPKQLIGHSIIFVCLLSIRLQLFQISPPIMKLFEVQLLATQDFMFLTILFVH